MFNDYHDIEQDIKHPKKSKARPLASGAIQKKHTLYLLSVLYLLLAMAALYYPKVLLIIGIYLMINIAYTISLKNQVVINIFCIAIGFVLGIYAGASSIAVQVSSWMFVTTLCLALYLTWTLAIFHIVIPAKAGIHHINQYSAKLYIDPRLRGDDREQLGSICPHKSKMAKVQLT